MKPVCITAAFVPELQQVRIYLFYKGKMGFFVVFCALLKRRNTLLVGFFHYFMA